MGKNNAKHGGLSGFRFSLVGVTLVMSVLTITGCASTNDLHANRAPISAEKKAPANRPPAPSLALAPDATAWGGAALTLGGKAIVGVALHNINSAGFWQIGKDSARQIALPKVGYHPDCVTTWGKDAFAVAVEGAGKIEFWKVAPDAKGVSKVAQVLTPFPTRYLVSADLDGDGHQDLILAPYAGKRVAILWGKGDYQFSAPQYLQAAPTPWKLDVVDWNKDGRPDLVWSDWDTGSVRLYENQGHRHFSLKFLAKPNPYRPRQVGVGDIDHDGWPDAVMALEVGKGARILYHNGTTELVPAPVWGYVSAAVMSDGTLVLGEEGRVILARKVSGTWRFRELGAGSLPSNLLLTDLNHDGKEDLVVFNSAGGGVSVQFGPLWKRAKPIEVPTKKVD